MLRLTLRTVPTLAATLLLALVPAAQAGAGDEATHAALRQLKTEIEAAFNRACASKSRADLDAVLALVSENVVLTAMNGQCVLGKQGLVEYFERTLTGPEASVESVHHTFTPDGLSVLHGDDMAVAYGASLGRYELVRLGKIEVNTRWTCTMVREGERWLVASFQFAPSVFENPLAKRLERMLYVVSAGAALAGLALGFTLGRRGQRRSAG